MNTLTIQEKNVDVYPASTPGAPVIYLHTFGHEGKKVYQALQKKNCPDFTLAAISNLLWDHDMTPWDCPPISRMDTPCTGGADDYLTILTDEILPEVEKNLDGTPCWRGVCGYSLAGLFAVYALYQTDRFSRAASMSGSLWFPGLTDYIFSHEWKARPDAVYFSLGDKESKTNNSYLKTTQERTAQIQEFYAKKDIDSVFVLNPGNHYVNADKRTAAGIEWILKRERNR